MANVDEILLRGKAAERSAAGQLREDRAQDFSSSQTAAAEASENDSDEDISEEERVGTLDILKRATAVRNTHQAVLAGLRLGFSLRRQIRETNFDSATFYTVLCLSIFKDSIDFADFATLGIVGPLTNIAISITLFLVFFLRGSFIKRYLIKRFLWPSILSVMVEFIPFIDTFPTYTVMAILLKMKMDKDRRSAEESLSEVQKEIKRLASRAEYEKLTAQD